MEFHLAGPPKPYGILDARLRAILSAIATTKSNRDWRRKPCRPRDVISKYGGDSGLGYGRLAFRQYRTQSVHCNQPGQCYTVVALTVNTGPCCPFSAVRFQYTSGHMIPGIRSELDTL